jgi:transcriptional regulator with XRE-family HTH domain
MNESRISHPEFAEWFEREAGRTPEAGHMSAIIALYTAVREQMEAQGVTQAELARRADLKPSYISRLFSTPENITMRTAFRLCNALDLTLGFDIKPKTVSGRAETPPPKRKLRAAPPPRQARKSVAVV